METRQGGGTVARHPRRRPTAAEACACAQMAMQALGDTPSGLSMMLDIVDMCKLLDYEREVCLKHGLGLLPRTYFQVPGDHGAPNAKFVFLTLLVLWLLRLNAVPVEGQPGGNHELLVTNRTAIL